MIYYKNMCDLHFHSIFSVQNNIDIAFIFTLYMITYINVHSY